MKEKNYVSWQACKVAGLQTADSLARTLGIGSGTAINYLYKWRKLGLVETTRAGRKHLYKIYPFKQPEKGTGLYSFISKRSKIKVVPRYEIYFHNGLTVEEAIVKAVESGDFRLILAALNLFGKITSWPLLNKFAKKARVQRKVGVLYELAKTVMRVHRPDKRTLNSMAAGKSEKYIVKHLRSKDFPELEKKWHIYVPFSRKDMEEYND